MPGDLDADPPLQDDCGETQGPCLLAGGCDTHRTGAAPTVVLTLRIPAEYRARIDSLAAIHPGTMSDWARRALLEGLQVLEVIYATR